MGRSEVSTSVVKWNEGLCNRVSIIRRYIDHMKFAAYMAVWFFNIFYIPLVLFLCHCVLCVLLFNFVNFAFFLSCYVFFCCMGVKLGR